MNAVARAMPRWGLGLVLLAAGLLKGADPAEFVRQVGTYGLLVGLPYDAAVNRFVDAKVVSHGQRSVTAVEYPLNVNTASLRALSALPGIGAKRAARIVRARPFGSLPEFAASLDDPSVADRVASFVGLAA